MTCTHRWLLAPNGNGPDAPAVCRLCGAERVMSNTIDGAMYDKLKGKQPPVPTVASIDYPALVTTPWGWRTK